MGSRTAHRILGMTLLTVAAGVAAGVAATTGAGPLAELPGHDPAVVPVSARTTTSPSPLRADILFPTAAPAVPTEHTDYVQDPAPPPIIVAAPSTPLSAPAALALAAPPVPVATAPPTAPSTQAPAPPSSSEPVASPSPTPTRRPRPAPGGCFLFCGGGG